MQCNIALLLNDTSACLSFPPHIATIHVNEKKQQLANSHIIGSSDAWADVTELLLMCAASYLKTSALIDI